MRADDHDLKDFEGTLKSYTMDPTGDGLGLEIDTAEGVKDFGFGFGGLVELTTEGAACGSGKQAEPWLAAHPGARVKFTVRPRPGGDPGVTIDLTPA